MKETARGCAPLISILTPTWNRAAYLNRVWDGLDSQTYKHIEWIVSNDGSTDETESKLIELCAKSPFPVTIISASVRVGKARMDNEAVARARGEFIVWNDSDDILLPHAIEHLVATWNSIPETDQEDYVGVSALCANEQGLTSTPMPKQERFDTTWNDLTQKLKVSGDMLNMVKATDLKNQPFPEVDFVIPEGVVWTALGHKRIRIHPEVLKVVEYRAANCISFSGKMEYCRGRAYAMTITQRNLRPYSRTLRTKLWRLITYIRYSIHAEIGNREAITLWGSNSSLFSFILMMPVGHLLAMKDRLRGKVRKTHRDFIAASKIVTITCTRSGHDAIGRGKTFSRG